MSKARKSTGFQTKDLSLADEPSPCSEDSPVMGVSNSDASPEKSFAVEEDAVLATSRPARPLVLDGAFAASEARNRELEEQLEAQRQHYETMLGEEREVSNARASRIVDLERNLDQQADARFCRSSDCWFPPPTGMVVELPVSGASSHQPFARRDHLPARMASCAVMDPAAQEEEQTARAAELQGELEEVQAQIAQAKDQLAVAKDRAMAIEARLADLIEDQQLVQRGSDAAAALNVTIGPDTGSMACVSGGSLNSPYVPSSGSLSYATQPSMGSSYLSWSVGPSPFSPWTITPGNAPPVRELPLAISPTPQNERAFTAVGSESTLERAARAVAEVVGPRPASARGSDTTAVPGHAHLAFLAAQTAWNHAVMQRCHRGSHRSYLVVR